jgi:hypothetical protein
MDHSLLYITLINSALCASAILIHYEVLNQLSIWIPRIPCPHRLRILLGLFGAIFGHVIEIWLFAFGYYYLDKHGGFGQIEGALGAYSGTLLDCSYFSFTTYTSLGFGDIHAVGDIRYLTGLETLIGLVLISWTASFIFIEMQRYWANTPRENKHHNG